MEEKQTSPVDIREAVWKLRRYRWVIALPIIAAFCAAFLYLKFTPHRYESHVLVSVGERTRMSPAMEPLVRSDRDPDSPRERIAVLDTRVHSRSFLTELASRMGLTRDPGLLSEARTAPDQFGGLTPEEYATRVTVLSLSGRIRVTPLQGSLVRITAGGATPRSAMGLASSIANLLMEESKRATLERAEARSEFSSEQIAVYEERLRKSEAALRSYQESVIGGQLSSNMVRQENVDLARSLIRDSDEEIEQLRGRIQSELALWRANGGGSQGTPTLSSSQTANLESRLRKLEVSYGMAALRDQEGMGDLSSLKLQIGQVRQALFSEYESLARTLLSGTLSDAAREAAAGVALDRSIVRSLRDKRARLSAMVSDYTRALVNSPRQQLELERLQGEVATNRDLLLTLRKEATSSRISEALETSQLGLRIEVEEPAQLPLAPTYPDRNKVLGAALLVGPLFSIGLVLAMERLGAVIRNLEEAEKEFGAPVIGTIPRVEGWPRPGSVLQNYWALMAIALVLLVTSIVFFAGMAARDRVMPRATSGQHR